MAVHTGMVPSGSAQICYKLHDNGKKQTLVLLHGNGESSNSFTKLIPFFGEHFDLLLIDSRGHGQSTMGDGELSLDKMAIDLENVLDHLKIDHAHILGFSDGANVAMIFAPKNNSRVDRLVLVGGNLNFGGFNFKTKMLVAMGYFLSWVNMKLSKNNRLYYEYYYLMYKEPRIKPESINKIQAKTLVAAGDRDMIKLSHTNAICNSIKNGVLKIFNGDHFFIYTCPEEFCEYVIDFLTNTGDGSV